MARIEDAPITGATAPPARGSPSRRRLLALLGGVPAMGLEGMPTSLRGPSLQATAGGPVVDPMSRLFAEFRARLDRHEAALAACDRIEATLTAQIGPPRVALPPDEDGVRRHATDAGTLTEALPPGRHRRRLQRAHQRRQRRWDEAARGTGLTAALLREAALDEAVLDHADGLIAMPAQTFDAVVIKLLVLLSTREPGPAAAGLSPWRELRTILQDLRGLVATGEAGR